MQELLIDAITQPGVAALIGVVVGGVLSGVFSFLLEKHRAKSQIKLDLLKVRREVELEGLEAVHRMSSQFHEVFLHNYQGDDEDADRAQAEAVGQLIFEADNLRIIALRVDVLASRKVAQLVQQVPDRIFEYFDDAMGDDKIYAAKANHALDDIRSIEDRLKQAVRDDLKTKLIDPKGRTRPK